MVAVQKKKEQKVEYVALNIPSNKWNDNDFFEFCQLNDNLQIERLSTGEITIMGLTGGETGINNSELNAEFVFWNRVDKMGKVFDSSTGFKLPNSAIYSPDVAWIHNKKWNALSMEERKKWVPFAPDFVCELLSNKGQKKEVITKMQEFIENGSQLGWMIDPFEKMTYIFQPVTEIKKVAFDQILSGGQVLKGLKIKMSDLFE